MGEDGEDRGVTQEWELWPRVGIAPRKVRTEEKREGTPLEAGPPAQSPYPTKGSGSPASSQLSRYQMNCGGEGLWDWDCGKLARDGN